MKIYQGMREFYIVSDGGNMDLSDFIIYVGYLKSNTCDFKFNDWFDENDFSNPKVYLAIKKLLQ